MSRRKSYSPVSPLYDASTGSLIPICTESSGGVSTPQSPPLVSGYRYIRSNSAASDVSGNQAELQNWSTEQRDERESVGSQNLNPPVPPRAINANANPINPIQIVGPSASASCSSRMSRRVSFNLPLDTDIITISSNSNSESNFSIHSPYQVCNGSPGGVSPLYSYSRSNSTESDATDASGTQPDFQISSKVQRGTSVGSENLHLPGPPPANNVHANPTNPKQIAGPSTSASSSVGQAPVIANHNGENNQNDGDGNQCTRAECLHQKFLIDALRGQLNDLQKCLEDMRDNQDEKDIQILSLKLDNAKSHNEIKQLKRQLAGSTASPSAPTVSPSKRHRL